MITPAVIPSLPYTKSGGYFAIDFKRTGFDAIIIKGKSSKPVYIWITEENVEFKDGVTEKFSSDYHIHQQ